MVIGIVLAGGAGRRIGGGKPARPLAGRPLAAYPVRALAAFCARVAIVARADTELPPLPGEVWLEPDGPRHPLTGLTFALARAREPVLVLGADMPFVTTRGLEAVAREPAAHAAVARAGGRLQPLLARYEPSALAALRAAGTGGRLTEAVLALEPAIVDVPARVARSIDTPAELRAAERDLIARQQDGDGRGEAELADAERRAEVDRAERAGERRAERERDDRDRDLER